MNKMAKYRITLDVEIKNYPLELVRRNLAEGEPYWYSFLSDLRWIYLEQWEYDGKITKIEIEEVE